MVAHTAISPISDAALDCGNDSENEEEELQVIVHICMYAYTHGCKYENAQAAHVMLCVYVCGKD